MITTILALIIAIITVLISGAIGKKVFDYLKIDTSNHEKVLFATVTGFGIISVILFFLGIVHLYYRITIIVLLILSIIFLNKGMIWTLSNLKNIIMEIITLKGRTITHFFKILLLLFIICNLFFSFTPEVQWDSLVYHLTVPKIYVEQNSIVEIAYDYHSYFPKLTEIFFIIGETLSLDQFSKCFMFLFNLFLILGAYVFCRDKWDKEVAIIVATILYTIPIMAIYQPTTYNDIAMTLFLFYACIAFLKSKKERSWVYICGIMIGSAAATKIISISMLGFFSIYYFISVKKRIKFRLADIIIIILMCLLIVTPWLTLAYVQTKNPVYPFFYNVLGGEGWTSEIEEFWGDLRKDFGPGRTLITLLTTPWNLTMHPMLYGPIYGYTPLFLIFIPLFLLLRIYRKEKTALFFLYFIIYYIIIWFLLASDGRYIFPILPACTIISTLTIIYLWKQKKSIYKILIPILLIIIILSNLVMFAIMNRNTAQVLLGIQKKDEYLQNHIQNYELVQWINQNLEEDAKIFVANDDRTYFIDREYIRGYPIIQGHIDYTKIESDNKLREILKQGGITHIILTKHETDQGITLTPFQFKYNNKVNYLWTEIINNHGEFIIEKNNVYLYKLG